MTENKERNEDKERPDLVVGLDPLDDPNYKEDTSRDVYKWWEDIIERGGEKDIEPIIIMSRLEKREEDTDGEE